MLNSQYWKLPAKIMSLNLWNAPLSHEQRRELRIGIEEVRYENRFCGAGYGLPSDRAQATAEVGDAAALL